MTVTYTFTNGTVADADEVNQNFTDSIQDTGLLGEVRMFGLSMTGALTKANLQALGWAICDGTTPASQGISSPTIATTPNLEDKFISMSNDETSGTTGGSATMGHTHTVTPAATSIEKVDGGSVKPARVQSVTTSAASNE